MPPLDLRDTERQRRRVSFSLETFLLFPLFPCSAFLLLRRGADTAP